MKTCWSCGAYVPDTAKFCRDCGAKLTEESGEGKSPASWNEKTVDPAEDLGEKTEIIVDSERRDEPVRQEPVYEEPVYEEPVREEPVYEERAYEPPRQDYDYEPPRQDYDYEPPRQEPAYRYVRQENRQEPPRRQPQSSAAATPAWDHTAEFDPKDISENKVMAMLVYLMGWVGILIALLGGTTSPYAAFHVRQGLKFVVLNCLIGIIGVLLLVIAIPVGLGSVAGMGYGYEYGTPDFSSVLMTGGLFSICWIVLAVFEVILFVVKIICFFSICNGKAKEPPIVRAFGFLR